MLPMVAHVTDSVEQSEANQNYCHCQFYNLHSIRKMFS